MPRRRQPSSSYGGAREKSGSCPDREPSAVASDSAARSGAGDRGAGDRGADDHGMDDAVVLEEHREAAVVPARDRRLLRRASAYRGMAGGRRAELLLDLVHGEAALRTIELRLAHLHLIVDHEG